MAIQVINIGDQTSYLSPDRLHPHNTSTQTTAAGNVPFLWSSAGIYPTESNGSSESTDPVVCTYNDFTWDNTGYTLYAPNFAGNLIGTATNATNVNITTSNTSSNYPLVFTSSVTAGNKRLYTDTANELYYNPNTKTLTTTTFKGSLSGTATNATYINVASASNTNASYYIQFVNATTGNKKSYTDSHLKYNPYTNILTASQVDGKLNGPMYTYVAGTNLSYYITFVNGSTAGMRYSYVDSSLIYNPSTNTLTAGKLCGYLVSDKQGSWSTSAHNGQAAVVNDATGSDGNLVCLASMTAKGGRITIGTLPTTNSNFCFSYHKTGNTSTPDKTMIWDYQANTLSTSGGFYETSDERLKDLQEDIEVNFSYLHNIPKKYYSWKDDSTYTRHIGTSAQEVQKYYPELVNTGDDGYLTMNYDKLSIVALKAIDVLHEEVTELKKENAELKERLARLEELILNNR